MLAGIDIGSAKICTIIAQVTPEGKKSVIGVASVPSRGIKKGVVVDIDEAVEAIAGSLERAERMAGYAVGSAFITVDGSHITSLNSKGVVAVARQEGEITEEDVARATEAAQAISIPSNQEIIHVIPRGFVVDSQEGVKDPAGMSGIRLEVETNIIYGSATAMRNLVKCVQQVGVDVNDLVFGGIAASEAVLNDTEKELGTVLADIGGGTVDLTIFWGSSPVYSAVLPIGGQNVTNDLAIGLRTSLEDAEKIKIKLSRECLGQTPYARVGVVGAEVPTVGETPTETPTPAPSGKGEGEKGEIDISELGLEAKALPRKLLNDVIKARLNEIASLIALEIKKSGLTGKLPGGVVLTGGASETYGTTQAIRSVLKMPVRIGYPAGVTGLIEEIGGPAYAASVGLVIFGSKLPPARGLPLVARGKIGAMVKGAVSFLKSLWP